MKKKLIISISLGLLLFVAFFLMLILTETPMNLSLIASGVATLITGTYLGLVLMGKPLKAISTNICSLLFVVWSVYLRVAYCFLS